MNYLRINSALLKCNLLTRISKRTHWNEQYKPGKFPTTNEERAQAAKKYNLDLRAYQPYPDDGNGLGDYPKLPDICGASKDPFYPWDYPELKRNFDEPMHLESDLIGEDRFDIDRYYKLRPSINIQILQFFSAVGIYILIMYYFENFKLVHATAPKQFPHQGKTHYTFNQEE